MLKVGDELGGREILRELAPGKSWLARAAGGGAGGREVVIKVLEEDCLLGEKLHPSIRQRLERVRELPEKNVANLHGVERDGEVTYLVWDWVEGESLTEYVKHEDMKHEERLRTARELVLAVQSLHLAGIVHGAIHEGNVIVDPHGAVWLIDVSPLLWGDEQEDVRGVMGVLGEMGIDLPSLDGERVTLEGLLQALAANRAGEQAEESEPGERWWSLILAGVAIIVGIGVAVGIGRYLVGQN